MLGDLDSFIEHHWQRRPREAPAAGKHFAGAYSAEQFLRDLAATHRTPYLSVGTRDGDRIFTKHATTDDLHDGVMAGDVAAMKVSKFWHGAPPTHWLAMRTLFGALVRRVSMMYMNPPRSEDVDIFLAGPRSCLGTHFDTTDVFTLQLSGERRWVVETEVDVARILAMTSEPGWYPAKEIEFRGDTREVVLSAGDALYVPAYAVHRVTGVSASVSLSLGLRSFNELDFVEHLLESIRLTRYTSFPPVRTAPESAGEDHVQAKLELMRRVRALLEQVEGAAFGTLLDPMTVPSALDPLRDASGDLGMFRTGFALEDEHDS